MWWLLCLTIVLITLIVTTFGGGSTEVKIVEVEKKPGDAVETKKPEAAPKADAEPALTFLNF